MTGSEGAGGRARDPAEVFEYAVLRVVPRVDRGEAMNAGVLLYCRPLRYLGARIWLDTSLLLALDDKADVAGVERALAAAAAVCGSQDGPDGEDGQDGSDCGAGPAGQEDIGRRFRWLTAPRSTVVQTGPVHTGLTRDPEAEIARLLRELVLRPR